MMILPHADEYIIEDNNGRKIPNGPMFLKVIIRNTVIDTQATLFHLRDNLRNLTNCIEDDDYDIETFNLYVTTQVEQLNARGEKSTDRIIYLFSAYLSVPDNKFTEYIEQQKDKLDEEDILSPKKLMKLALNKYKERKQANK
jgi:DNA-binding SARP family transcriptional activator